MWIILLAFICGIILDMTWTLTVQAVQSKRALMAANLSVLIYTLTLLSTILVIEHCIPAIIAYGVGNWIGTYWTIKR